MALPSFDTQSMLKGLHRWVEIESPTDVPEAVNRMMDAAEEAYREAGARLERLPGSDGRGDHLIARSPWGEGDAGVLILPISTPYIRSASSSGCPSGSGATQPSARASAT
jgi:glutamate carboxypeptidase